MRTFGRGLRVIASYRQSDSDPLEPEELASALAVIVGAELTEYDTARSYGKEHILGAAVAKLPADLSAQLAISTKTSPNNPDDGGGLGGFSRAAVLRQGDMSREQLQREQVLVCYLHNPDVETDLDETLGAMDELYRQGFFKEFGISNFPAWQVMQIWMKCKERGFCLPSVYQGVYNPIARQVEAEILPCCRMLGMRFNA
jgi:aflatoxin B1 aldehyde reductase